MCTAQCLARMDPGKARATDPASLMAVTCPTEVFSTLTPSSCPTAPTDLDKQDILCQAGHPDSRAQVGLCC